MSKIAIPETYILVKMTLEELEINCKIFIVI